MQKKRKYLTATDRINLYNIYSGISLDEIAENFKRKYDPEADEDEDYSDENHIDFMS